MALERTRSDEKGRARAVTTTRNGAALRLNERELFDALVRWLPYETLEEFAEDVTADWDIDPEYEE